MTHSHSRLIAALAILTAILGAARADPYLADFPYPYPVSPTLPVGGGGVGVVQDL